MHIQDFVDRVYLIDNKDEEIEELARELKALDIDVLTYNPSLGEEPEVLSKNRQLIFVDLMLDEDVNHRKSNLSQLLSILSKVISKSFGNYGLILWTKHPDEEATMLKQMISELAVKKQRDDKNEDDEIKIDIELPTLPMFIVTLSKNTFIEKGSYVGVLDVVEQELRKSNAGYFFMRWIASVKTAMDKTVSDVYSLCKDYENQEREITYILYKLAKNHTGIDGTPDTLCVDTYKAFDELLYADLFMQLKDESAPVYQLPIINPLDGKPKELGNLYAALNTKLFIDDVAINQQMVIPGNIYELQGDELSKSIKEKLVYSKKGKEYTYLSKDIAIELTPPCDNTNKKKGSRIVIGYIVHIPKDIEKDVIEKFNGTFKEEAKQYVLHNIFVDGMISHLVFDYRHLYTPSTDDLRDPSKYRILFRAKPKLFADILQKFSSHAARLGLSDIH